MTTILTIDTDAYKIFDIPNQTGTPERRLLLAILERAILDYVGNDEREADEADQWLFEEDYACPMTFSFSWICQELDLDKNGIQAKIKSMPKRGASRIAPWYMAKEEMKKAG